MAKDFNEEILPYEFEATSIPHGMLNYKLQDITPDQQRELNDLKLNIIRENHKYLASKPEIHAIIVLIVRLLLKKRPQSNLQEFVGKYFAKNMPKIQKEIESHLRKMEKKKKKKTSTPDIKIKKEQLAKPVKEKRMKKVKVELTTSPVNEERDSSEDKSYEDEFSKIFAGTSSDDPETFCKRVVESIVEKSTSEGYLIGKSIDEYNKLSRASSSFDDIDDADDIIDDEKLAQIRAIQENGMMDQLADMIEMKYTLESGDSEVLWQGSEEDNADITFASISENV